MNQQPNYQKSTAEEIASASGKAMMGCGCLMLTTVLFAPLLLLGLWAAGTTVQHAFGLAWEYWFGWLF